MKARKKPIEKLTPADLGVNLTPVLETIKVTEPPKRVGGGKVNYGLLLQFTRLSMRFICLQVENVDQLVAKLKEAGFTAYSA